MEAEPDNDTTTRPGTVARATAEADRPFRGRRLSWAEFTRVTGRSRPDFERAAANDNDNDSNGAVVAA
jgi:hypothetical protein